MKKFFTQIIGELSLKAIVVSLLFLIALFSFAWLGHIVSNNHENAFDDAAFAFFHHRTTPELINIMKGITFFGSTYFIFSAYILLIVLLIINRRKADAINVIIVAVTSTLLILGLKEYFKRKRPDLPLLKELTNFSFPSGHAVSSFIFFSVLIYLAWKTNLQVKWKWVLSVLLMLFAISIGISRIVLRYHYATDVLAGFCLGFAWVILSLWLERSISKRFPKTNLQE